LELLAATTSLRVPCEPPDNGTYLTGDTLSSSHLLSGQYLGVLYSVDESPGEVRVGKARQPTARTGGLACTVRLVEVAPVRSGATEGSFKISNAA
jgi:hypothetical protein